MRPLKRQPIIIPCSAIFLITSIAVCIIGLLGCSSSKKPGAAPTPRLSAEHRLLILPFKDMTVLYGPNGLIKCPVCDSYFTAGPVSKNATDFLTAQLIMNLETVTSYRIEIQNRLFSGLAPDGRGGEKVLPEIDNLVLEGRALKMNYLMTGYVYRFRERVGRGFSVQEPASVAFSVHLIDTLNQRVMWSGTYEETQQPLSENLFNLGTFVNRGGGWVKAEELAGAAMKRLLRGFGQK